MEKLSFENKSIENNQEGSDIAVSVLFTRHAEKASHGGDITKKGQEDAQQKGRAIQRLGSMKGADVENATHSGHKRTAGTAFLINNPDYDLSDFESLSLEDKKATGSTLNSSVDRYSENADKKYAELAAGNFSSEGDGVEYFARLNNERYDEDTLSSVEMGKLVAQDLMDLVESTKKMPAHSKKFITNVVHSGVFEHFLIDLLKKRGEESPVKSIGGSLGFLGEDDFRFYIKREDKGKVNLSFRFRNKDYGSISEEELRALAY